MLLVRVIFGEKEREKKRRKGKKKGKKERKRKKTRGCLGISPQIMIVSNKHAQDVFMLILWVNLELLNCAHAWNWKKNDLIIKTVRTISISHLQFLIWTLDYFELHKIYYWIILSFCKYLFILLYLLLYYVLYYIILSCI